MAPLIPREVERKGKRHDRRLRLPLLALVSVVAVALSLDLAAFSRSGKAASAAATTAWVGKNMQPELVVEQSGGLRGMALGVLFALLMMGAVLAWGAIRKARELQRPYQLQDLIVGGIADPEADLTKIITFIQEQVIVPIDVRLPGRPFEYDLHSFPFTPMVLVIGNHSSGKSTFINRLLGVSTQETGVAPTDDGFTVLERRLTDSTEDGPTVFGCPENRPFRELQRFGQAFSGHFRRKRKALPDEATMPFGLQIVDTPGMIDLPVMGGPIDSDNPTGNTVRGRGYNFVDVVRWWAKRADLILLLFDPDKPGTTGETLEVLTKSLAGLDHKFLVVLNKVDQLDNSVDFARAYGTLGWALSKVIRRKDIPQIYTMYNAGFDAQASPEHKLPLEDFAKRREEVVAEVCRAKERHLDNVVTALEETLRQVSMTAMVLGAIRAKAARRLVMTWLVGAALMAAPLCVFLWLLATSRLALPGSDPTEVHSKDLTSMDMLGVLSVFAALLLAVTRGCREFLWQSRRLQKTTLDESFEEVYADFFIHNDGEDHRARWMNVKPKISSILNSITCASSLKPFPSWEMVKIDACLTKDVWHLRQLARMLRLDANGEVRPSNDRAGAARKG
mmetsp:Transcript_132987/g.425362  ORF Transcript_132987/g.425362 Transcript_132987/m.425362 type:complete len:619 (-) Transcript_132987:8-1864(-)